jgi:penicillin-binding protein 1A
VLRLLKTLHKTGEVWQRVQLPQSSLVFARDGSLIGEIGHEWRTSVSIRSLPAYVPKAFVAVEDQRFYQHDGVDLVGIAGAIKGKIFGENRGGASTITQQLVGYLHPDLIDRRDISLSRKLHEQSAPRGGHSKDQILSPISTRSASAADGMASKPARHYFGHPAARLTLAEAAARGLPKFSHYVRWTSRRRETAAESFQKMAEQGYITPTRRRRPS